MPPSGSVTATSSSSSSLSKERQQHTDDMSGRKAARRISLASDDGMGMLTMTATPSTNSTTTMTSTLVVSGHGNEGMCVHHGYIITHSIRYRVFQDWIVIRFPQIPTLYSH
jgi:hypothetical protein